MKAEISGTDVICIYISISQSFHWLMCHMPREINSYYIHTDVDVILIIMNVRISCSHNYYILVSSTKFNVILTPSEQFFLFCFLFFFFRAKVLTQTAWKAVKMLLLVKTRLLMAAILRYSQTATANPPDPPGLPGRPPPHRADPPQQPVGVVGPGVSFRASPSMNEQPCS